MKELSVFHTNDLERVNRVAMTLNVVVKQEPPFWQWNQRRLWRFMLRKTVMLLRECVDTAQESNPLQK